MELSRHPTTVYQAVAAQLEQALKERYRCGDYLPSEQQLADHYEVNRHTLRRAVDELVHKGLLQRRHGVGILVLMRPYDYPLHAQARFSQNLLEQAKIDLNFQSPETVCTWYTRWSDEFDAAELAAPFWRWQSRFTSLKELDWLRISGEPLYAVMYEIPLIVRETPEHIRVAERWQVPNKLADRSGV